MISWNSPLKISALKISTNAVSSHTMPESNDHEQGCLKILSQKTQPLKKIITFQFMTKYFSITNAHNSIVLRLISKYYYFHHDKIILNNERLSFMLSIRFRLSLDCFKKRQKQKYIKKSPLKKREISLLIIYQ